MSAYFCGYDDFIESSRAKFNDQQNRMGMLTTTHFGTPKYRPVSRIVTYLCQLAENAPLAYRMRNLGFHLVAVGLIFALGRLLGAGAETAGLGAALFAVHPMAHQTISAAIFSIDMAYALMLGALCLFLLAYRDVRRPGISLAGMSALLTLALLTYESTIIMCGCCVLYLLLEWWRGGAPAAGWKSFLLRMGAAMLVPVGVLLACRLAFVQSRMPLTPPGIIVKNLSLYLASLALPVDLLLLNSLFGTPLPSEILRDPAFLLRLGGILGLTVLAMVVWLWRRKGFQQRFVGARWGYSLWLLAGIVFSLVPFLVFSDHPSETYQYLPAAFYSLGLSMILADLIGGSKAFRVVMGVLILLAVGGSWMRGDRVSQCAVVAQRIVNEAAQFSGSVKLQLANAPGAPPQRRFGLYGYQGLGTIDPLEPGFMAIQNALRVKTGKANLEAQAMSAEELEKNCGASPDGCLWVALDGHVQRYRP